MIVTFAKCLDRPFTFLSLKGTWFGVFVGMAVVSVILAVVCGCCVSNGFGVASAFAFIILSYFFCFFRQKSVPYKSISRMRIAYKCFFYVSRKKTVARILRSKIKR